MAQQIPGERSPAPIKVAYQIKADTPRQCMRPFGLKVVGIELSTADGRVWDVELTLAPEQAKPAVPSITNRLWRATAAGILSLLAAAAGYALASLML
jgi:hypothetical protein